MTKIDMVETLRAELDPGRRPGVLERARADPGFVSEISDTLYRPPRPRKQGQRIPGTLSLLAPHARTGVLAMARRNTPPHARVG